MDVTSETFQRDVIDQLTGPAVAEQLAADRS